MKRKNLFNLMVCVLAVGWLTACDIEDEVLEIEGSYTDSWGTSYELGEELFSVIYIFGDDTITANYTISSYDNDAEHALGQDADEVSDSFGKWSRFDWTVDGEDLYFCQITFDEETEDDAEANTSANREDLLEGCNGSPWSLLTPV